jgi:hypothetical protein
MKTLFAWFGLLMLALGASAAPDAGPSLQQSFVWPASAPAGKQAYVMFRKEFTLAAVPGEAELDIFADSRYILWINGDYVLRGPCRFDPKFPEYDRLDVRRHLRAGANTIEVLVHHYAGGHNSKIMAHDPGLALALSLPGGVLCTDATWTCSRKTPYLPSPSAWGSIPDVLDGRIAASAADWEPVASVDGGKWGALQPRLLPLSRETELPGLKLLPAGQALAAALPLELAAGQEVLVDLGRMAMAYATVDLEADAGSVLRLQYSLRYVNGHPGETYGGGSTYTARAGRQGFTTGDEWGCHYVTVKCVSGKIKLFGLKMTDRRYPFERLGRFASSDDFLNRLWEMSVNTIESTCDDGYGADARERNEWLQDPAQPNFITTRVALAGPGADGKPVHSDPRLLKSLMRHIALSQTPDGRLKGHALSDRWDCHGYIEDYACQWVESLRLYYEATGDQAFVREMWPALVRQMQWFLDRRTPRGLVLARQYTSFDDPLAYITGEGTALNAFVYQALIDAGKLGRVIGKDGYEKEARELAAAINAHLWNGEAGTYNSGFVQGKLLGPTAHAALLALDRGVVPPERVASTRQWFLDHYRRPGGFHCVHNPDFEKMVAERAGIGMPVTYYWVFQEFYRMNSPAMDTEALREMRRRWARMVNTSTDTGTLWEMFNGPESCHNYGAVPAYFLSSFVLGVRLDGSVLNKRLLIEPRLGDLAAAEGIVVTEFGPVPVAWKRQDTELAFQFEVPQGIEATVSLPEGDPATLVLDGKKAPATLQGRGAAFSVKAGRHEGRLTVKPAPAPLAAADAAEQLLSAKSAPLAIIARTSDVSLAGLEADVAKDNRLAIAAVSETGVPAHEGGAATAAALYNGTTRNGAGGDETTDDGKTFRGYGKTSVLTFQLDTAKSGAGYDLTRILSFAGHADARASQAYTVLVAFAADPAKFVKLAEVALNCEGGASEVRLAARDGGIIDNGAGVRAAGVVAVRFEFADGPLGFNVYREINLVGQPAKQP